MQPQGTGGFACAGHPGSALLLARAISSPSGLLTDSTQHLAGSGTRASRNENSSFLNVRQEMIFANMLKSHLLSSFPF